MVRVIPWGVLGYCENVTQFRIGIKNKIALKESAMLDWFIFIRNIPIGCKSPRNNMNTEFFDIYTFDYIMAHLVYIPKRKPKSTTTAFNQNKASVCVRSVYINIGIWFYDTMHHSSFYVKTENRQKSLVWL